MTATYRPRMAAQITLPGVAGTAAQQAGWFDPADITLPLRVQSADLVQNDPQAADELRLVVDYNDGGVDPRILAGGVVAFWLDNADAFGNWTPNSSNTRFLGRITKASRKLGGDSPSLVELSCLDYTSFFLTTKPLRTDAIPTFAMDLSEAWALMCNNVPGASTLAGNLTWQGDGPIPRIGDAVAPRFRAAGKPVVRVEEDAWAIWSQLCGSLGLVTYIFLDQCIVTTALDYYTVDDPPVLIYGQNILHLEEERHNDFDRKGVGVTCFDPLSGTTLEAVYPPHGDARVQPKHVPAAVRKTKASKKPSGPKDPKKDPEKYDYFQVQGVTDQTALDQIARYTYEVRSKQEMQGTLTTSEMSIARLSAVDFDLLTLHSGDLIKVQVGEIDADGGKLLASLPTVAARAAYFLGKGYSAPFAQLLAENLDQLVSLRQEFYVKSVATKLSTTDTGGTFEIEIHYCNKIVASGSTENTAGTDA